MMRLNIITIYGGKNKMVKEYIPKSFPEKAMLIGGGMFANQFLIVNVLDVKQVNNHPFKEFEGKEIPQAIVQERKYNGIEIFEPYLVMYHLYPLAEQYKDLPIDEYFLDFKGGATGHYTKHYIKGKKAEEVKRRRHK